MERKSSCAPGKCSASPPTCRTKPGRSKTRSTSMSLIRRAKTGSTRRTIIFAAASQCGKTFQLIAFAGAFEEFSQVLLPDGCPGVRAVTMGLFRSRQQKKSSILYALDLALGDAEFRRIDEIIRGIDEHHLGANGLQFRGGIVVARGVYRIEKIVGVEA